MNDESVEALAERLAARGREALVARLRLAFSEAAAAHADLIQIDDEQLERLVQGSADRADGLQWRRALATVAAGELGIPVTEALGHPAVTRAQQLLGAPTYDESLAELIKRPVPSVEPPVAAGNGLPEVSVDDAAVFEAGREGAVEDEAVFEAEPEAPVEAEAPPEPEIAVEPQAESAVEAEPAVAPEAFAEAEPETVVEAEPETFVEAEPEPAPAAEPEPEAKPVGAREDGAAPAPATENDSLRVAAIHLGGVANLPTDDHALDLRLSDVGLDILRGNEEIIGRLGWSDIDALDVPVSRSRLRRRSHARAQLIIRTAAGDASFEIPDLTSEELRARVEVLFERFGHS